MLDFITISAINKLSVYFLAVICKLFQFLINRLLFYMYKYACTFCSLFLNYPTQWRSSLNQSMSFLVTAKYFSCAVNLPLFIYFIYLFLFAFHFAAVTPKFSHKDIFLFSSFLFKCPKKWILYNIKQASATSYWFNNENIFWLVANETLMQCHFPVERPQGK